MTSELQRKSQTLDAFLDRHNLDGVMLWHRNNFAWLTGGADNHIGRASPVGVAGLLVRRGKRVVCVTNAIEAPRFRDEELKGSGIEVVSHPWEDPAAGPAMFKELVGAGKIAADHDPYGGCVSLPADFAELRYVLSEAEVARYRMGARIASEGMEAACRKLRPLMTEKEIAAELDYEVMRRGGHPVVTLIAGDERFDQFRHPIPTAHRVRRVVMLVICSSYKGLITNLTRVVHFGKISESDQKKIQAVANIDATVIAATKVGRTLGEIFADLQAAYTANNYPGQWKHHHQGGTTGYNGREVFANPTTAHGVLDHQAFAWNPSVPGCKSEDTYLISHAGHEMLSGHSPAWPGVDGVTPTGQIIPRASWLEV